MASVNDIEILYVGESATYSRAYDKSTGEIDPTGSDGLVVAASMGSDGTYYHVSEDGTVGANRGTNPDGYSWDQTDIITEPPVDIANNNSRVYVPEDDAIEIFDRFDGENINRYNGGGQGGPPVEITTTSDNGAVMIHTTGLVKIDYDGNEEYRLDSEFSVAPDSVVALDGTIYIAVDGNIREYDSATGALNTTHTFTETINRIVGIATDALYTDDSATGAVSKRTLTNLSNIEWTGGNSGPAGADSKAGNLESHHIYGVDFPLGTDGDQAEAFGYFDTDGTLDWSTLDTVTSFSETISDAIIVADPSPASNGTFEEVSASQVSSSATVRSAGVLSVAEATQPTGVGTMNTTSVLESANGTPTSTTATMDTPSLTEQIDATSVSTSATMDTPRLTDKATATTVSAPATTLTPDTSDIIVATQPVGAGTMNVTSENISLSSTRVDSSSTISVGVTSLSEPASQPSAVGVMNGTTAVDELDATGVSASTTMLTTERIHKVGATVEPVTATMRGAGVTEFSTASPVASSATVADTTLGVNLNASRVNATGVMNATATDESLEAELISTPTTMETPYVFETVLASAVSTPATINVAESKELFTAAQTSAVASVSDTTLDTSLASEQPQTSAVVADGGVTSYSTSADVLSVPATMNESPLFRDTADLGGNWWKIEQGDFTEILIDAIAIDGGWPDFSVGTETSIDVVFERGDHRKDYETLREYGEFLSGETVGTGVDYQQRPYWTERLHPDASFNSLLWYLEPGPGIPATQPWWVVVTGVQDNVTYGGIGGTVTLSLFVIAPGDEGTRNVIEDRYEVIG